MTSIFSGLLVFTCFTWVQRSLFVFIRPFVKNGHWTWWFFLLVGSLGFGSLVFGFFRIRIRFVFLQDLGFGFLDLDFVGFLKDLEFGFF